LGRTKIGVVVHQPLQDQVFSTQDRRRLESLGEVIWTDAQGPLPLEQAAKLLADCEIGVGTWGTVRPSAELLALCPKLRLWEHAAGTVRHMFGDHLKGRNLMIASCAPAIAENVAETTLGCLIVGLKRIIPNANDNRRGRTPKPPNARALASTTIGLIGASQVGRRVIRNLRPHGPTILLYDPFVTQAQAQELGAQKRDDLVDLCRQSNAVTLHAPNLPSTKGMLTAKHFQAMPDDCVFVNTARGDCVDEPALIEELQKGRLFAFLDVTSPEPAADDSPLRRLPNVILTSHIAGGADYKIGRQVVDDIASFLRGERPAMVVTEEMLDRVA
jgi:phosphoglycerate dehydrogenase-like enzyme